MSRASYDKWIEKHPYQPRTVDNTLIREAVEASGIPIYQINLRLGWEPKGDRLARRLGKVRYHARGEKRFSQRMNYELALQIINAIHVDPMEVGL